MFLPAVIKLTHLSFVHPEVGVDNDHVPGVEVASDLAWTHPLALWWRLQDPTLDAANLDSKVNRLNSEHLEQDAVFKGSDCTDSYFDALSAH